MLNKYLWNVLSEGEERAAQNIFQQFLDVGEKVSDLGVSPGRCGKMHQPDTVQIGEPLSAEVRTAFGLQSVSFCPPPAGSPGWRRWSHDRGDQRCWLKEQAGVGDTFGR